MPGAFSQTTPFRIAFFALQLAFVAGYSQKMPEAYYRAEAALEQNDTQNALRWADSCFTAKPFRYQYYLIKGQAQLKANLFKEAIENFLQAEKQRAGVASYQLARAYCLTGDTLNCIEWTRRNLQSVFREPESKYQLNSDFKFAQSLKEWQNLWLNEWYSPIEKDIFYAKYLNQNQNYDEAIELLNKRIKSSKSKTELFELRGLAHLGAGNYSLALKDFESAYKRSKKNHSYLVLQSQALYYLNQHENALKLIGQAIEKGGEKPEYLLLKAQILAKLNRWTEGYETTKKYLEFFPNNFDANLQLVTNAYNAGFYTDALLAIAKMLKFTPDNPELILLRGKIYLKTEQPRQAIIDFDKTIALNYKISESYLLKGQALLKIGEHDEACRCFSISGSLGSIDAQNLHFNTCKR
ncbi:MAG: tetratricopeptide repeat protein [Bacteroidota bacterium]